MYKYPKHYRIPHDSISVAYGKRYLEEDALNEFLKNKEWIVLEKVDGSQLGIGYKGGLPYLQGKNSHIPQGDTRKAYTGVWPWAWKNIEKFQKLTGKIIYGEWLKIQHNLPYDMLPDWFVGFDVYDVEKKRFLDTHPALKFIEDVGFPTIPIIYEGRLKYEDMLLLVNHKKSAFSSSDLLADTHFTWDEQEQIRHPHFKGTVRSRFDDDHIYLEGGIFKPPQNLKWFDEKGNTYWRNAAKLVTSSFLDEFEDDSHWTSSRMRENKLAEWNISNEKLVQ